MHILIIPSWYPTDYNELRGIFFKEQVYAVAEYAKKHHIGILSVQLISIKEIVKNKQLFFRSEKKITDNSYEYIYTFAAIPKSKVPNQKLLFNLYKKRLEEYIVKHGTPDLIHLHSFVAGEIALYAQKKYKIPYIVTEHSSGFSRNLYSQKILFLTKNVYENSKKNIAVSKQFQKLLQDKFDIEFEYIPNIVDTDFFYFKENDKSNNFNFINVAFLNKNKKQNLLIKSFYKAFKDKKSVKLTIVGEGSEYNNLQQLIRNLNMQEQINLYGRADRLQVRKLYQQSDAFVLSSQYETFGVVVIEAMSCGLPVVATRCGGPESIVDSNALGYLSDIDEEDLSLKLSQLYEHYHKFDKSYIRKHVVDNFSKEYVVSKLIKIYKSVYCK
jgi:glycosyltransferase involved in cell wall biosynthesis